MSLSTHVLDLRSGRPAAGIPVTLEKDGVIIGTGATDADGRYADFLSGGDLTPGQYQLNFDVADYFAAQMLDTFYRTIPIVFIIQDAPRHYHVPLLLSPYGYSTYRGS
ncbi:MAG: hydroxyisourate hydrolase [Pseudomonadota bacterium]